MLLRFSKELSSENMRNGQVVELEVGAHVYQDNVAVISEGTPVKGLITAGIGKGYAGEGGKLDIGNFYIILDNNQRVNLNGIMRLAGEDKRESLIIDQCCPLGYLIKGEEAHIEKGQTFKALLSKDEVIEK